MSTLRQDPTTEEWVILAPRRASRPRDRGSSERPQMPPFDPECPFCPGNEDRTPPEIARAEVDGAWEQRVVPNLFAAVERGEPPPWAGEALFREMVGVGAHEVLVESPRHDQRLDEMDDERLGAVLRMWRDRYTALRELPAVKTVTVFRNFGPRAGTSLPHPHSQAVATPVYAPASLRRYSVATRYYDGTGRCVYDDVRDAELRAGERVVIDGPSFVAIAPFASHSPYETWILPRRHLASFGEASDEELADLAPAVRGVLAALRAAAGDPDYNLVVQSAPAPDEPTESFLWHLQLMPRTTTAAGFELGSGMHINPMPPERAAEALRAALRDVG